MYVLSLSWWYMWLINPFPHRQGGRHLYFRLDIILARGLSKHTQSTYFPGMKIDPKYTFCMFFSEFFPLVLSKICEHDQKHTLFSNFACFWTPKWCTHVHSLVLKNNPNYVNFYEDDIQLQIQVTPPDSQLVMTTGPNFQFFLQNLSNFKFSSSYLNFSRKTAFKRVKASPAVLEITVMIFRDRF